MTFGGDRFLHVHLAQSFAGESPPQLYLHARARQFSSFVVLLGTVGGTHTFEPKHAFILQNKDELRIPLLLEQLRSLSSLLWAGGASRHLESAVTVGGFSAAEFEAVTATPGVAFVSLGRNILRAETAALAALAVVGAEEEAVGGERAGT